MASSDMPRLMAWVARVCLVSAEAVCGRVRVAFEVDDSRRGVRDAGGRVCSDKTCVFVTDITARFCVSMAR